MIIRWIINALALIFVSYLVPGFIVDSFVSAFFAAFVLGLVNALIRPVLLILTLPINIISLGFFTLIINALMLSLASQLVPGFTITSFTAAFFGGIILWIVSMLLNALANPDE